MALMESFDADGSDGRAYRVLVRKAPSGGERLATEDGLTVVPLGGGRYGVILTGVRLTRRDGPPGPAPDGT